MADYLLWGKDGKGKNGKQNGLELRSKHGTWDQSPIDSLDQLMEMPTFNEAALSALGTTQFRTKKETFSREDALANAPEIVRQSFVSLFYQIDKLDLQCAEWDLLHGKRTKPIRAELLKRFNEEELRTLREAVTHWNQYHYLKQRHLLVEMRREQYTLRDSYRKVSYLPVEDSYTEPVVTDFDVNVEVLPLGAWHDNPTANLLFSAGRGLNLSIFSDTDLEEISRLYWEKKGFAPTAHQTWFDFREMEHVYQLLNFLEELQEMTQEAEVDSNLAALLRALQFYIAEAELTDIQREILDMKLAKKKNVDIAWDINHKYGKTYTPNYISTIFRQKIIPKINEAAKMHEENIGNIFFPENFKNCTNCGSSLLICPENFMRRARSSDGFATRCKRCEKKIRKGE